MRKFLIIFILFFSFANYVNAYTQEEFESANFLAEKNIINNHKNNPEEYKLDDFVLRQEIAVVARGIAGIEKKEKCENKFIDVSATKPNTWACYTVEALRDNDLIAKNKKFNPEKNITKAEAVAMIVKAGYSDEYNYDSSKKETWQEQVINFAVEKGIIENFTDYNNFATRGFVFNVGDKVYSKVGFLRLLVKLDPNTDLDKKNVNYKKSKDIKENIVILNNLKDNISSSDWEKINKKLKILKDNEEIISNYNGKNSKNKLIIINYLMGEFGGWNGHEDIDGYYGEYDKFINNKDFFLNIVLKNFFEDKGKIYINLNGDDENIEGLKTGEYIIDKGILNIKNIKFKKIKRYKIDFFDSEKKNKKSLIFDVLPVIYKEKVEENKGLLNNVEVGKFKIFLGKNKSILKKISLKLDLGDLETKINKEKYRKIDKIKIFYNGKLLAEKSKDEIYTKKIYGWIFYYIDFDFNNFEINGEGIFSIKADFNEKFNFSINPVYLYINNVIVNASKYKY